MVWVIGVIGLTTQLQDMWVASSFGLLQMKMIRTFLHKFSCQHRFSFLYDKCVGVRWLGHMVYACLTSLKFHFTFLSAMHERFSLHAQQHLVFSNFFL